jgi:hypothetical protein
LALEDGTDMLSRNVGPKPAPNSALSSEKSEYLKQHEGCKNREDKTKKINKSLKSNEIKIEVKKNR